MPRFLRKGVLCLVVLVAGCQSSADPTTTVTPTTTTVPLSGTAEPQVYEMLALASHPNGMQLRVDRVELLADSVVVSGSLTNGSPYGISIDGGTTKLDTDSGEVAGLLEGLPEGPIPPGGELPLTMRFSPVAHPSTVTLVLNSGGGSSTVSPATASPSVLLGPIPLDTGISRPVLPDPVPLRRSAASPAGAELQVEGINFSENRIGVWVRIANPSQSDARIAPTFAPSLMVDDLGNQYPLVLPERAGSIVVPAGSARSGVLSFAGRIHPNATSVSLWLNAGVEDASAELGVIYPSLTLEALPLIGDAAATPLPNPVEAGTVADHPSGVRLQLATIEFTDAGSSAELVVVNNGNDTLSLAALPTHLVDDLGNRYPLVAPVDNPRLMVEAATTVEGTFVFSGRIAETATQITLVLNSGGSSDNPNSPTPSLAVGPYDLVRSGDAAEPIEPRVFAVSNRSRLVDDALASSEVEQITQTLTQFNATPVDGGFRLTLPDSIMFDFNSNELRPDAAQSLALIADVLRYFEGDQVIVIGHTDSIGGATYNQRLSQERAQSVVDTLIADHAIASGRLAAEGHGADEPIAPNTHPDGEDNPEGRQSNRRVEIIVLTDRDLPVP